MLRHCEVRKQGVMPMRRMQSKSGWSVLLFALFVLGWTDSGHILGAVADDAGLVASNNGACSQSGPCEDAQAAGYLMHWVSKTRSGNLFLVVPAHCADAPRCGARFVERTPTGIGTRLSIEDRFRVLSSGKPVPDVQTWRDVSGNQTEYTRYSWVSGAFLKVETRTAYRVDGVECGTALDCYQAAVRAHEQNHNDKALKIWEQVHNVSWI